MLIPSSSLTIGLVMVLGQCVARGGDEQDGLTTIAGDRDGPRQAETADRFPGHTIAFGMSAAGCSDRFGSAAANRLLIGDTGYKGGAGGIWVVERSRATEPSRVLTFEGLRGAGVALLGNCRLDSDSTPDFAVGCVPMFLFYPEGQNTDARGGLVLVSGSSLTPIRTIFGSSGSSFGSSLCTLGDVDGDGVEDVVVGAPCVLQSKRSGSAVLISGATGNRLWESTPAQSPSDWEYGTRVLAAGDLDGDGVKECVISAPIAGDHQRTRPGYVTVVSGKSGTPMATLREDGWRRGFAGSVAVIRPKGDAASWTIAVGCTDPGSGGGVRTGMPVVLFDAKSGRQIGLLPAPEGALGDGFGASLLGVTGRTDDTAGDLLVTSAIAYHRGALRVAVYSSARGELISSQPLRSLVGVTTASIGDWDGDEVEDFACGANLPWFEIGEPNLTLLSGKTLTSVWDVQLGDQ